MTTDSSPATIESSIEIDAPPARVWEVSPKDGMQHIVAENTEALTAHYIPGELRLFRIQPAGEAPFEIEYYLDK